MFLSSSRVFKFLAFLSFIILGIHYWMTTKSYLVDYKDIEQITKRYIGKDGNVKSIFANIENGLRTKYGKHILPKKDTQWIFINCGGWMGSMYLLHASLTEYILFFGTSIDTSGHSGRYWANVTDTVISGTFRQWSEGEVTSQSFKPGDTIVHTWGEATGVQWSAGTYMVEYGRGFIPSTLGFALADNVFGTTDFITLYYTLRIYAKALINEAWYTQEQLIKSFF